MVVLDVGIKGKNLRCNNQLQNVTVKNCTNVKIDERIPESVMRNLILSCKQLRSLNIEGTQFFASRFCQDLVQLAHLRSLNFGTSQCIRVKDMVTLSLCCRELQELKISHRRACDGESVLRDEDASFIFGMLKDSLRSLAFDMCGLGATSYQAIFQCTKLNDLCLNNALNLSSELFRSLADYLPEIRRLTIGNAGQLSSEDFIHLFTSKSDIMSNLTSLKLCGCWRLGDKGLETIVDTCGDKLEQLSARSCKSLTSDSIEYVILKCDKLCHLDIAHIIKLDAVSLGHIAIHLPCLQMLVVDADLKKETWLHQLKSKMPHLKIKRSFSEYCKNEAMFS